MLYRFDKEKRVSLESKQKYDMLSISIAYDIFKAPGACIELRALLEGQVVTGFFDVKNAFCSAAEKMSIIKESSAVWVTQNPVPMSSMAMYPENTMSSSIYRIANTYGLHHVKDKSLRMTADTDIEYESTLVIDVDPHRNPSGISSTDEELNKALDVAEEVMWFLDCLEMPNYLACSSNGWHVILPYEPVKVDDQKAKHRELFFKAMDKKFSTNDIGIDTAVSNLSRVIKLYGTPSRKGANSIKTGRYHRVSWISRNSPPHPLPFSPWPELTKALKLDELEQAEQSHCSSSSIGYSQAVNMDRRYDIPALLTAARLAYKEPKPGIFALEDCPNNPGKHKPWEARITQLPNGAVGFSCFHDHCRWGWKEFRSYFERDLGITLKEFLK